MPLPVIADTYRVAVLWKETGLGLNAVNVLHLLKSVTTASAIAGVLDANVTAGMWANCHGQYTAQSLHVTPLDGASATFILAVSGAKWTGGGTGDLIPSQAPLVSLRSNFRGPRHRGRLYLPAPSESTSANGLLPSVATVQTAWNTWLAAMIAAGAQPVIASYKFATQVPVSSILVENALATQRRRQNVLR